MSTNLRLFGNSLQLYANATQKFYRSAGIYSTTFSPFRVQLQATYYWKSLFIMGAYASRASSLTENSNVIIRDRQSYLIEAGWGNGRWTVSLMARNFLSDSWLSETWTSNAPLYSQWKRAYSPSAHASLNLSVTYTINYGKKTRIGNEVSHPTSSGSAIISPQ